MELRNRVKQNNVTLPVTNSKIFIEILLSSYYLTSWNFKLNFELPTQSFKIYFSTVELLTRSQKTKKLLRVTNSIVELFLFHFRVTNLKLKNKKLLTPWWKFYFFVFEFLTRCWKVNFSLRVVNSIFTLLFCW